METISLKALARKVLERNQKGNHGETNIKTDGNFRGKNESKSFPDIYEQLNLLTEAERNDFEERAAIMEIDGEMPRKEAEQKALERIKSF
tara:strand:- start:710 stop:979 length:270 start_codon:yes stop_codon:yes gene_type:complete